MRSIRADNAERYAQRHSDSQWFRQLKHGRIWGEWIACDPVDVAAKKLQSLAHTPDLPDD